MNVKSMQDKLLNRYMEASKELLFLLFPDSFGVSERLQVQLGFMQISKTANTIDKLITEQVEFLLDAVYPALDAGAQSLTEDKKKVFQNALRVLQRASAHVRKAISLIQSSQIYQIETSEEARRLKLQQRRVSAFKIVEKLDELQSLVAKKTDNLKNRAQKITLSPTFERFRSRSPSAVAFKSRSLARSAKSRSAKSRSAKSRSAKSRSRSATSRSRSAGRSPRRSPEFVPGQWKRAVRIKDDVVDTLETEDGETEFLVRLPSAEVARLRDEVPQATRFRMGYNF
jgi:hypothetical protein